jgi:glycine cleavage system regulatory protein
VWSSTDWDLSIRKNTPRAPVSPNLRQRQVSLSGEDKPGIMHATSSYFAEKGINILSMNVYNGASSLVTISRAHRENCDTHHARAEPAAFASSRLFKLQALVQVPEALSDDQLEDDIEAVGEKEGVDMWLESSQPSTPPAALHEAAPGSRS